ncbi:PSDC domain protein, putative, partial [Rhizoctonia solani AG-3 Rhs1AP]
MELSQHLFDLQMARHMRTAGESQPRPVLQQAAEPRDPVHSVESTQTSSTELITDTNNAGTGASATADACLVFQQIPGTDVLERLTVLTQQPRQPTEHSDALAQHFNQLFERFNQLVEQSKEPAHRANQLAERSNELAEEANQLTERLGESSERSNQLSEQTQSSWDQMGDVLGNINRVLVAVQHAVVRIHTGDTASEADYLVDEEGRTSKERSKADGSCKTQ